MFALSATFQAYPPPAPFPVGAPCSNSPSACPPGQSPGALPVEIPSALTCMAASPSASVSQPLDKASPITLLHPLGPQ